MKIDYFGEKIIAAFSSKKDGSMRVYAGETSISEANTLFRRGEFLLKNEVDSYSAIYAGLRHSNGVEIVSLPRTGKDFNENIQIPGADALVTGDKGLALALMAADCPSLYLYDPEHEVIALAHCGWKGILAGIVEKTVERMESEFDVSPSKLLAYLGPGIKQCHFEVKKDVAERFKSFVKEEMVQIPKNPPVPDRGNNDTHDLVKRYHVDLTLAVKERLVQSGMLRTNFRHANQCTFCYKAITELQPLPEKSMIEYQYFSFRRDKSNPLETQMAVFMMKP